MKIIKKLKKINSRFLNSARYLTYYRKLKIEEKTIFLEAQNARNFNGNIYYIAKELNDDVRYKGYNIYMSISKSKFEKACKFFEKKNITRIKFIEEKTKIYYKLLASAKYLFTDTSFNPCFIKKTGQIVCNTWHGTPLKTLGRKVRNEPHKLGNIQKNFVQSDYLLYPNEYMRDHMIEDYMLQNICKANTMLLGYPRNTAFFDEKGKEKIREELNLQDKQVIVYMPTWRGGVSSVDNGKQNIFISYYLLQIDQKLKENQVMYVQLHPFVSKGINFKMFKNIKQVPNEYETYEFLNIADCLITDYSSVFIDFAIKRKKIILFTYDKKEYLENRGMYLDIDELPFPKVENVDELLEEINTEINYDDRDFLKTFCRYEANDVTKKICEKVILDVDNGIILEQIKDNGKENILIYVGNLAKNGITTSIKNLLDAADTEKYNYYITFMTSKVEKYKEQLFEFPPEVNYIAISGKMNATIIGKILLRLYDKKIIKAKTFARLQRKTYETEIKRLYYGMKFSNVIQFNGYESRKILLFSMFNSNKIIFVHNDMNSEVNIKKNQRKDMLKYAYPKYDKIALVTEDLVETMKVFTNREDKFNIVNNIIDYKRILDKSKEAIQFDEDTEINIEEDKLIRILENNNCKKFINIGRFSPEKGQKRLLNAFNRVWKEQKDTYLIIIGGYGKEYSSLLETLEKLECKDNVIIIKSISNPYPILKRTDYFVLSSYYEGFGIVIAEADILNKAVISTDIVGPKNFMKNNNGTLVEDSEDGLYRGMKKLLNNEILPMNVNYEKYNQNAVKQFEQVLNKNQININNKGRLKI